MLKKSYKTDNLEKLFKNSSNQSIAKVTAGYSGSANFIAIKQYGKNFMKQALKTKCSSERGATMLEYMFLALLILLVCMAGVKTIGETTAESFESEEMKEAFKK